MHRTTVSSRRRSVIALLGIAGLLVAVALIAGGTSAFAGGTGNRLDAKVLVTNAGPLPACAEDGRNCTDTNGVRQFIRIENGNALLNQGHFGGAQRGDVPNAFVVSSIDEAVFVNGVQDHDFDLTYTPPPNPSFRPYSGHWAVSVTCPPGGPPCTQVGDPAVLPGEETSVFWTAWGHGDAEPNGTYVFKFTVHGTLNGSPVNLTASTPPIVMTS